MSNKRKTVEFDEFLKFYSYLHGRMEFCDYWGDMGFEEGENMLKKFSDDDWNELKKIITERISLWQERLMDCLYVDERGHAFEILLMLADTDDREVLYECCSLLLVFDEKSIKFFLSQKKEFLPKIKKIVDAENRPNSAISARYLEICKLL